MQWLGFVFFSLVSFFPKSPHFTGKYAAKCFQKGGAKLPEDL
jgi:hypothetical protein